MPDLRCDHRKFGAVSEGASGTIEAVCLSNFCGRAPGVVILHRWNLEKVNEDGTIRPEKTFRIKKPELKGNPTP